jgi:hypothetical protein
MIERPGQRRDGEQQHQTPAAHPKPGSIEAQQDAVDPCNGQKADTLKCVHGVYSLYLQRASARA